MLLISFLMNHLPTNAIRIPRISDGATRYRWTDRFICVYIKDINKKFKDLMFIFICAFILLDI
jgi:hypothetical protein